MHDFAWFQASSMLEMSHKIWSRAVWLERNREEEGVVPTIWIEGKTLRWPNTYDATKFLKEMKKPGENWKTFPLQKIKIASDKREECEDYDFTTSIESGDEDSEDEIVFAKRVRKRKTFSDYEIGENADLPQSPKKIARRAEDEDVHANSSVSASAGRKESPGLPKPPQKVVRVDIHAHTSASPERTGQVLHDCPRTPPRPSNKNKGRNAEPDSPSLFRGLQVRRSPRQHSKEPVPQPDTQLVQDQTPPPSAALRAVRTNRFADRLQDLVPAAPEPSTSETKRKKSQADSFPMSEERFQRKVLYLLIEIRDSLKKSPVEPADGSDLVKQQLNVMEEFLQLEERLEEDVNKTRLKSQIKRIGGIDAEDHTKKAMARIMTNGLMALMNMQGKKQKKSFRQTKVCAVITEAVLESHQTTEAKIYQQMANFLKYAPERAGGGGRRQTL